MKYNKKPLDLSVKTLRIAVRKQDLSKIKKLAMLSGINKKIGCTANAMLHYVALLYVGGDKMLEIARLLLKVGADVTIKDKNGNLPQDIARQKANYAMEALFLSQNSNSNRDAPEQIMIDRVHCTLVEIKEKPVIHFID